MRTSKFTPEQMVHVLRQADTGIPVVELCRQHGISEQTFYRWKKRFGDLGTAEVPHGTMARRRAGASTPRARTPRNAVLSGGVYCRGFFTKSSTTFDMSKLFPPWTGGYSASVFRCWLISSPIGPINQDTFCIRCP